MARRGSGTTTKPRPSRPQNEAVPPQAAVTPVGNVIEVATPDYESGPPTKGWSGAIEELPDNEDDFVALPTDDIDDTPPIDLMSSGGEQQAAHVREQLVQDRLQRERTEMEAGIEAEVQRRVAAALAAQAPPAQALQTLPEATVAYEQPTVVEPAEKTFIVRTNVDVGPIFYGRTDNPIEMKKGVKYRVPEHIFVYLMERDLVWSRS